MVAKTGMFSFAHLVLPNGSYFLLACSRSIDKVRDTRAFPSISSHLLADHARLLVSLESLEVSAQTFSLTQIAPRHPALITPVNSS